MKLTYCKIHYGFGRFKKVLEQLLGLIFIELPYDKETNFDLTKLQVEIPDSMVEKIVGRYDKMTAEEVETAVRDHLEKFAFMVEFLSIREQDDRLAIVKMHKMAENYEAAGFDLHKKGRLHDFHNAISNAKCLRLAANLLDGNCSNGGG
jgi:hypothetical protein